MIRFERIDGPSISKSDYKYLNRLGEGGFGRVFLAREKSSGKKVAIKECYKAHLLRYAKAHYVMRERQAMSRMNSPYICKLFAAFQDQETLYFVMEFMPGGDLLEPFLKYGGFRNEVTRFYSAEIIMALEYLRTVRIVHRDLKMENVLLDRNLHAKLTDFGTAVILENTEEGSRRSIARAKRTRRNSLAGTENIMSPEVLDEQEVTYSSDLWSLGCMIFEMHTGGLCFEPDEFLLGNIYLAIHTMWPTGSNPQIMHLVDSLIKVDPTQRLGAEDMSLLKNHDFYGTEDTDDWDHLRMIRPPPFDPRQVRARRTGDLQHLQPAAPQPAAPQQPDPVDADDTQPLVPADGSEDSTTFGPEDASELAPALPDPPEFIDWDNLEPTDFLENDDDDEENCCSIPFTIRENCPIPCTIL